MENNGWYFQNVEDNDRSDSSNRGARCSGNSWFGWKTPTAQGVASMAAVFTGSGSAKLQVENCWIIGQVIIYLDNKTIATIKSGTKNETVSFEFSAGSILNITTRHGIVKLNSLEMTCRGKTSNFPLQIKCFIYRML